jgi:hypothetical protein
MKLAMSGSGPSVLLNSRPRPARSYSPGPRASSGNNPCARSGARRQRRPAEAGDDRADQQDVTWRAEPPPPFYGSRPLRHPHNRSGDLVLRPHDLGGLQRLRRDQANRRDHRVDAVVVFSGSSAIRESSIRGHTPSFRTGQISLHPSPGPGLSTRSPPGLRPTCGTCGARSRPNQRACRSDRPFSGLIATLDFR